MTATHRPCPVRLLRQLWPSAATYDKEREILLSLRDNKDTVVRAGNQLGKDWTAGRAVVMFFLAPWVFFPRWYVRQVERRRSPGVNPHTVRIVTTSIKDDHLRVLWDEIGEAVHSCSQELDYKKGGRLILNHRDIRRVFKDGRRDDKSYLRGMVSELGEGLAGHHAAYTLAAGDEASGLVDKVYTRCETWRKKGLWFGNPFPCENFWRKMNDAGDIPNEDGDGYLVKVIKIAATDSPNVRLGIAQNAAGLKATHEEICPGVMSYQDYLDKRRTLNAVDQCIKLDGEFYLGAELLMFPPEWLDRAHVIADSYQTERTGSDLHWLGVDPAEGGDLSAFTVCSKKGIKKQISIPTPDTNVIPTMTLALMREWNIPPEHVAFDRGGGGKQHADRMRAQGHHVRTVAFGEAVNLEPKRSMRLFGEKVTNVEERYAYMNRRVQMYHEASLLLDPAHNPDGYGIPRRYAELRRQLGVLPRWHDKEDRMYLPPKSRRPDQDSNAASTRTLKEILGCSPDEADSWVLAVHAMLHKATRATAGAVR